MKTFKRGQGSFEYILLLAGVLLIVVLAVVLLRGQSGTSGESAKWQQCKAALTTNPRCYDSTNGNWAPTQMVLMQTLPACQAIKDTVITTEDACSGIDKRYDLDGLNTLPAVCCGVKP